jgi:glycosyltransferase involved in cell wall biosynthesis
MRIAYVCADLGVPVFGRKGCSIHVQEVLRALAAQGAAIELFTMRPEGDSPPGLEAVRLHALPLPPKVDRAVREQLALLANRDVRAALARAGTFDLIYERYSLWSFAAMELARDQGVPGLLEVNAPLIEEQVEHRGLVDRAGAERVAGRVFGAATALVAVSDEVATYLRHFSAIRGPIHVVPNGVATTRFRVGLEPSCPSAPGTFTVGFVGSLKPWHGLSVLVEAFARLHRRAPNTRLLIVGDGPERPRLEADLAARGLGEASHLTDAVAPEAVPSLLASMDVAVAPYPNVPHFYFSPLKVYEYMAAGLPVVASRLGQLAQLIDHEVDGLCCPAGDAEALAAALERLRQEPALRRRLGQAARAKMLRAHTWEGVVRRLLSFAGLQAASALTSPEGSE